MEAIISGPASRSHVAAEVPGRYDATAPTLPDIIDAAARILMRRGYQGLLFGTIARSLAVPTMLVLRVISDKPLLVRHCYQRTAAALESCLMDGETMSGSAAQKSSTARSVSERSAVACCRSRLPTGPRGPTCVAGVTRSA